MTDAGQLVGIDFAFGIRIVLSVVVPWGVLVVDLLGAVVTADVREVALELAVLLGFGVAGGFGREVRFGGLSVQRLGKVVVAGLRKAVV